MLRQPFCFADIKTELPFEHGPIPENNSCTKNIIAAALSYLVADMYFEFDRYSSLLLPAFLQGILFSALLVYRGSKNERLSDRLLSALLLVSAIKVAYWMLGFAGWYDTHNAYTSFMFYFPFNNAFWTGPLLYFYFLSLTNAQFRFSRKDRVHFILPLASLLLVLVKLAADFLFFYPFPDTPGTQYGTKGPWAELDKNIWVALAGYVSFFYYLFRTLTAFARYQKYIRENFSATEHIHFNWLRNLMLAVATGVLLLFVFELAALFIPGGRTFRTEWYGYFGLGVTIYYLSISGYYSPTRQQWQLAFDPEPVPARPVKEDTRQLEPLKQKLVLCMEQEKPYLDPELNLAMLAKKLKTNINNLSRVINEGMGQNFNDYINEYRVNAVIKKLEAGEQEQQTLLGIAYDCGFNSKATFNRSFKKITGVTPKDYTNGVK